MRTISLEAVLETEIQVVKIDRLRKKVTLRLDEELVTMKVGDTTFNKLNGRFDNARPAD